MKNLKKAILATCILNSSVMFAGGLLTNTNQSVHFIRNPARDASTEIDAAYTNPAGLAKLKFDGFHFSFSNQSAFQTRTITSTYDGFEGFGGNKTKEFEGKASAPIIPSLQGAYKKGKWVLSGAIAVSGGGGKATFDNGLPSFEALISGAPVAIASVVPNTNKYSLNQYMSGSSMIIGGQLGGTYAINEMFSAYAGFRLNVVNNGYEGYLRNLKVNLGGGEMVDPSPVLAQMIQGLTQQLQNPNLTPEQVATIQANIQKLGFLSKTTTSEGIGLDVDQSGWGVAPILGFNFNYDKLNIGVKYEFKTALDIENKTKKDDTGMFGNGVNTPHDIPALLTIGASYKILPQWTASIGYHHYFDSDAGMSGGKEIYAGSTNEYIIGTEYQIDKMFLISGGVQFTNYGVEDAYQSDLSFSCSSYALALGGAVNISPKVRLNIGYFWSKYSDYTKEPGGTLMGVQTSKDVFSRTNKVFAAGVDFSF